jgi:acyl carrier protein
MSTQDRLITMVRKFSKIAESDINASTRIKELKFDSLDLLEFQMSVDDEFGIEVGIEDFLKCVTVSDIVLLVENYHKLK